jgi:hypothetical protein
VDVPGLRVGDARLVRRGLPLALALATLALVALDVPLESAIGTLSGGFAVSLAFVAPFVAVGVLVARRQPGNAIGWLLLVAALFVVMSFVGSDYAVFVYRAGHRGWPLGGVAVLLDVFFALGVIPIPLVILLFPDGRLDSRWRRVVWAYVGVAIVQIAGTSCIAMAAIGHRFPVDGSGNVIGQHHPSGIASWFGPVQNVTPVLFGAFCLAAIGRQLWEYRHAHGVRRQQLKWLGSGAVLTVAAVLLLVSGLANSAPTVVWIFILLGWMALPLSIGVAITRFRLYEIERIISRTLAYTLLTGLLAGAFIGLIVLTTDVLAVSGRVGVAASTLVAAALFNPLRIRTQRLVDRRFNRARYDAEAIVAAFTVRLRDAVEIDTVRRDLLDSVTHAVQPVHASLWIKP